MVGKNIKKKKKKKKFLILPVPETKQKIFIFFLMVGKHLAAFFFSEKVLFSVVGNSRESIFFPL